MAHQGHPDPGFDPDPLKDDWIEELALFNGANLEDLAAEWEASRRQMEQERR